MTGKRNFSELRAEIDASPARRARVDEYKRGALASVELAELRETRELRQADVANTLGVSQANVSRLERQDDVYLSTLQRYISALGGALEVNAVFPDQQVNLGSYSSGSQAVRVRVRRAQKGGLQEAASRKTGVGAGKAASKVLRDKSTGKASKTAAGSALSQRAPRKGK